MASSRERKDGKSRPPSDSSSNNTKSSSQPSDPPSSGSSPTSTAARVPLPAPGSTDYSDSSSARSPPSGSASTTTSGRKSPSNSRLGPHTASPLSRIPEVSEAEGGSIEHDGSSEPPQNSNAPLKDRARRNEGPDAGENSSISSTGAVMSSSPTAVESPPMQSPQTQTTDSHEGHIDSGRYAASDHAHDDATQSDWHPPSRA